MQTKAADAFTKFFTPKDTSLLGYLRFTVNHRLGDGLFHGIKQRHVFGEKEYCDCGGEVDAQDAEDIEYLLGNKEFWAPCMRKSEVHSPASSLLLTLEDMNAIFDDIKELEAFMVKKSPSFHETLDATRRMIKVTILTQSLLNIKVSISKFTSFSITSEHIANLLRSNFRDEMLELLGLPAVSGPTSEFLLIDSESFLDVFNHLFRFNRPGEEKKVAEEDLKWTTDTLLRKYLIELLTGDFFVAELDFKHKPNGGTILLTPSSLTNLLLEEKCLDQSLCSPGVLTREERATLVAVIKLHINKEAGTNLETATDVLTKIIEPAAETFKAVNV